jgi:hypothetical protein
MSKPITSEVFADALEAGIKCLDPIEERYMSNIPPDGWNLGCLPVAGYELFQGMTRRAVIGEDPYRRGFYRAIPAAWQGRLAAEAKIFIEDIRMALLASAWRKGVDFETHELHTLAQVPHLAGQGEGHIRVRYGCVFLRCFVGIAPKEEQKPAGRESGPALRDGLDGASPASMTQHAIEFTEESKALRDQLAASEARANNLVKNLARQSQDALRNYCAKHDAGVPGEMLHTAVIADAERLRARVKELEEKQNPMYIVGMDPALSGSEVTVHVSRSGDEQPLYRADHETRVPPWRREYLGQWTEDTENGRPISKLHDIPSRTQVVIACQGEEDGDNL